ncbi:hypothetical protein [Streptomyces sp. GC420]|uniref:hypothetical protein n=1 Tax=Streptomyces sp. GC420 TaxID=2697568 RepID=UPI001414F75E|nr:hypothetical protein [Streptomyces sp. GC420]NBM15724.1 hypothetical protein [Streptomyces sp. GC420]
MVSRESGGAVRRLAALCVSAVIGALAVAGCGPQPGRPASDGAKDPGRLRDLTYAEQIVVERREEELVRKCMEKAGFRYWIGPVAGVADRQGNGYVLDDVGWAKQHGYGGRLDERAERAQLGDRNAAYARSLSRAEARRYDTALDGTPSRGAVSVELPLGGVVLMPRDGCRATAMDQLYGDFPAWFRAKKTVGSLTALYAPDIVEDPRFVQALGQWAECMRSAGRPYADPQLIRRKLPGLTRGMSPAAAHAVEVELAVAEATCATRTPLVRTARALEKEYRAEKLRPYQDDIAAFRRMNLTALARAGAAAG